MAIVCSVVLLSAAPLAAQEIMTGSGPEIIEVSPDNQIINNSRGGVADEPPPAAADPGPGGWLLGEGCADLSSCLRPTVSRGTLCGAAESLELALSNKCTQPAAVGVCAERVDGGWDCAVHKKLAQGKTEKHAVVLCHGTGRYNVRGTKATDLARDPDCLRANNALPVVTGVVPPAQPRQDSGEEEAPRPPPGTCTKAKACCRALAGIEGMHTLDNACAQMNPLTDENGEGICRQMMLLIQGTISPLPRKPGVCR